MKLFCIPYAGGSASVYSGWNPILRENIQLVPVELSGKGVRAAEPLYENWEDALEDVYSSITEKIEPGEEYALFGHSMGSWIAYEILKILCRKKMPQPIHVFFSGNTPPFMLPREEAISGLPDEEFIEKILEMGDTPAEAFSEEIRDYFLPRFKNDYRLVESYHHHYEDIDYSGGIHVFYGKYDSVTKEDAEQWKKYGHNSFGTYEFESGHMFIKDCAGDVVGAINSILGKEPL